MASENSRKARVIETGWNPCHVDVDVTNSHNAKTDASTIPCGPFYHGNLVSEPTITTIVTLPGTMSDTRTWRPIVGDLKSN